MNDDNIGSGLDLTHEEDSPRAEVEFALGSTINVKARGAAGPTTLMLAVASVVIMGTAYAIGVPSLTALIVGLAAPAFYYALVRLMSRRRTR